MWNALLRMAGCRCLQYSNSRGQRGLSSWWRSQGPPEPSSLAFRHPMEELADASRCGLQVGLLQERLRHVESTAQQARRLHAALQEAAVALKRGDAGETLLFRCAGSCSFSRFEPVLSVGCRVQSLARRACRGVLSLIVSAGAEDVRPVSWPGALARLVSCSC